MLLSRLGEKTLDAESLATTLRSIGDAILTTDTSAKVSYINPMAEILTGIPLHEAIGHHCQRIFRIRDESSGGPIPCPVGRVLDSGEATGYTNHTMIISREGVERPVAYNATPLVDQSGMMQGVVLVFHCAQRHESAARNKERFQLIERATNDAVWDMDLPTGQIWMNDAVTTLFGYRADEVRSDIAWWYDRVATGDRERVIEMHTRARDKGLRHWQIEYAFQHADGSNSAVFERGYVLRDANDSPIRMVGTVMDITGRREAQEELLRLNAELERRVEQRTRELVQANRELESFTYSVSHDLRAPLRSILFSSALLQEDNDHLDPEMKATLARLVLSANRMSVLIDDLLAYSRLSRARLNLLPIDLSEIVEAVAARLKEEWKCRAKFTIESGMRVTADRALMTILFENLLGNACKFSSKKAHPEVEVGTQEIRGERVFFVKDNGAGFDPAEADRLFQPFERLHSDREFEGTGIGLANVARIVHRHGGRVWAKGQVGEGATVLFTI